MQIFHARIEVLVHLNLVAVKFEFGRIKQSFGTCKSGYYHIHLLNEVEYTRHRSVRHCRGYISCNCVRKSGFYVGLLKFLLPRALAVEYIAVTLYHNVSGTEHIGQLAYLLCVFDRLIERLAEVVRYQNRKVGIGRLLILVRMSVDYCEIVVVILLCYKSAGILTESTHFVFERVGIAYELGLVKHLVDLFHNFVSYLDSHSDIYGAGLMVDIMISTSSLQPVRASSARSHDYLVRIYRFDVIFYFYGRALAYVVFYHEVGTLCVEHNFHTVLQKIFFNREVYLLCLFRTQMTYRTIHEFKTRLDCFFANFLYLVRLGYTLYFGIRAEFEIYAVGILYSLLRKVVSDKVRQIAAYVAAQRQFSVRESSRSGKARRNRAILAAHAMSRPVLGTSALFYRRTLFDYGDFLSAVFLDKLQRGKYTRGSCAYNQYVCVHFSLLDGIKKAALSIATGHT